METGPIADLSDPGDVLLPGLSYPVPNAMHYSNIQALDPAFAYHMVNDIYVARTCAVRSVILFRFDSGTTMLAGEEFLVRTRGRLVLEQIAPYLLNDPARVEQIVCGWRPTIRIHEECLLSVRYGLYTWGHWIGEILPAIVVAEAAHPGRFRFVLPISVTTDPDARLPTERIRESLLAYGIGRDRLLPLYPSMQYQFDRLYAAGPMWSDHVLHPGAVALMRERLVVPPVSPQPTRAVCLERIGPGRMIDNVTEVNALLAANGFEFQTVGQLKFVDQVHLFQSASMLFSVLGSDLSGLIYAPEGVRVISAAPAVFGDRFFYALLLNRRGQYADLRGPIASLDPVTAHRSSFHLDPNEVDRALARLGPPPRQ